MARPKAETPNNEKRQQILDVAEQLFMTRGYASVALRDIAAQVDMRHASLYYYVPGGKEQLYTEVIERNIERHRQGMAKVSADAGDDLREKLRAVGRWLISQPPMELGRLQATDFPHLPEVKSVELSTKIFNALVEPLGGILREGVAEGTLDLADPEGAAICFIVLVESLHGVPLHYDNKTPENVIDQIIEMLLHGWLKR
jgi:AcrR family transcriptional regulator